MRQPANPFHPGEILQEEFLQPLDFPDGVCRATGVDACAAQWTDQRQARDYGGVGAGPGGGAGDIREAVDEFAGDVGSGCGGQEKSGGIDRSLAPGR